MSSASLNLFLVAAIATFSVLASVKLLLTRLHRKYRALFCFLLVAFSIESLALFSPQFAANRIWFVQQPLSWFLSVWLVLELYSLILEKHKGLSTLGRWVQFAGFALSTLVSLVAMQLRIRQGRPQAVIVNYYYSIERGVDCGILVFLLVILGWLSTYPVRLSRNLLVHCAVYSTLFFSNSIGLFAQLTFGWDITGPVNRAATAILACCTFAWLILLTPKGEEVRIRVPRFTPDQERKILSKIEALNEAMLKLTRK